MIGRAALLLMLSSCTSSDERRAGDGDTGGGAPATRAGGGPPDSAVASSTGGASGAATAVSGAGGAAIPGSSGSSGDDGSGDSAGGGSNGGGGDDTPDCSGSGGNGGNGGDSGGNGGSGGSGGNGGSGSGSGSGGGAPDCTGAAVEVVGDVFDPAQVYLVGTLDEAARCGRDAVVHWSSPGSAVVGFDCLFDERSARIRPTDGRLLYSNVFEGMLREFHCDGCLHTGGAYPLVPLANDPVLPTPPCAPASLASLGGFLVSPGGTVLHGCSSGGTLDATTWYDQSGAVVYADPDNPLRHLGHGDLALAERSVVHLATSVSLPLVGLPDDRPIHTVRARAPDRFLLVLEAERSTDDGSSQELWEVDGGGKVTRLGAFPPLPAEAEQVSAHTSKLDACGALLQFGGGAGGFEDVIVRREIGGSSEVVYTEAADPMVKIRVSSLLTGP
ncbi:hypothetical protein [Sorangium cellulosum]|nr:hypothetical protein [Sorangium cellulosum]